MNDQKRLADNRRGRHLIGVLLCVALLIGIYPMTFSSVPTVRAENTIDDLYSQKEDLAKQQEALAAQRDETAASFEAQKQQGEIIQQQIEAKSTEIAINEKLLDTLSAQIAEKTANIAEYDNTIQILESEIASQQEELRVRLRHVSKKSGVTTFIQAILNSRNYTDYLIGFKMSEMLSSRSEQLMQNIEQNILKAESIRNQAKTDRAALEIEHNQASQVGTELANGKAELQALYADSNAVSDALFQDIQYLNEQIAAIDAKQNSLQGTINDVMEQIRLEEEAKLTSTTTTTTTTITTTTATTTTVTTTTAETTTTTETTTSLTNDTTTVTTTTASEDTTASDGESTTSSDTTTATLHADTTTVTSSAETTTTSKKKPTTTKKTTTTSKKTTTKPTTSTTKPPKEDITSTGSMMWPAPTCDVITSSFKYREQFGRWHYGIDIACYGDAEGEPVVAAADGIVRYANSTDTWGGGYGLYMILDHGEDSEGRRILTIYAHCSEIVAYEDQEVRAGDLIGYIGNTGNSYGAHLHFEVQVDGTAVDPVENGYLSIEGIDILG